MNFNKNTFYTTTVTVPNFLATQGTFRIQCDASDDMDQVYIDKVTITKITGAAIPEASVVLEEVKKVANPNAYTDGQDIGSNLSVYPNPVNDVLNIDFNARISEVRVLSVHGQDMKVQAMNDNMQLNIHSLAPGIYILYVKSGEEWYPIRFSKM